MRIKAHTTHTRTHTDPCTSASMPHTQVAEAHIPGTVDALLNPEAPLALRLTGTLLLGVVRLYSKKVAYLQQVRVCVCVCACVCARARVLS